VGRLFLEPFRNGTGALNGLGVGIAASAGRHQGSVAQPDLPQFKTMGQQKFFSYLTGAYADGVQQRLSPQFYYYSGPYGLLGEYIVSRQSISRASNQKREIDHRAWQIAAYWVVTGEDASYHGVRTPSSRFAPAEGTWGALEIAARFSMQTNDGGVYIGSAATQLANPAQSVRRAREAAIGLNWYLDRHVKVQLNYEETHFDGGGVGGDRVPEKVILTRFQIAI
jgi:phosphate-selective porin OprO/OprP